MLSVTYCTLCISILLHWSWAYPSIIGQTHDSFFVAMAFYDSLQWLAGILPLLSLSAIILPLLHVWPLDLLLLWYFLTLSYFVSLNYMWFCLPGVVLSAFMGLLLLTPCDVISLECNNEKEVVELLLFIFCIYTCAYHAWILN